MRQDIYCGTAETIGSVELVDYMGDDKRIVDAARVSFAKRADQFTDEENDGLLKYLWRNQHTGPFEQVVLYFRVEAPLYVVRQWFRHRTARVNEVSRRYVDDTPRFYIPEMRKVGSSNKQGSSQEIVEDVVAAENIFSTNNAEALNDYEELLARGVAPELARTLLPVNMMTEFVWQMDLHNLFHFLALRLDDHAQKEIRKFAEAILELTRVVAPAAVAVFETYNQIDSLVRQLKNAFKKNPEFLSAELDFILRRLDI